MTAPSSAGVGAPDPPVGAARAGGRAGVERRVRTRAPGEPRRVAYLYLLPALLFYVIFAFGPLLYTTWLSFFDWNGLTVGEWAGLDNYREVLERRGHPRLVRALARADLLLRGHPGASWASCSRR